MYRVTEIALCKVIPTLRYSRFFRSSKTAGVPRESEVIMRESGAVVVTSGGVAGGVPVEDSRRHTTSIH